VANGVGITIEELLDEYYRKIKGLKHFRFEENSKWILKKLLDTKQFPPASVRLMDELSQGTSNKLIEDRHQQSAQWREQKQMLCVFVCLFACLCDCIVWLCVCVCVFVCCAYCTVQYCVCIHVCVCVRVCMCVWVFMLVLVLELVCLFVWVGGWVCRRTHTPGPAFAPPPVRVISCVLYCTVCIVQYMYCIVLYST
jgi:hypothetical protein